MDEPTDNVDLVTVGSDSRPVDEKEATDESLVESACTGNERAFERLFERHRLRVARIVGRFFNRRERVEEIVQEIFTKLYFSLRTYSREQGKSFSSWLSSIAINSCYDELRRARRRPESSISEITRDEAAWLNTRLQDEKSFVSAETAVISRDLAEKLLARLDPDDRLILTLLDAEDLSVNEIAGLTGWSVSKVKVRAHRARAALRSVLSQYL